MSGVKISNLTAAASLTDADLLVAVDTATNTTKKITKANLLSGLDTGLSNIADSADGVVVSGPLKVGDLTISDDVTDAVLSFDSANDATFVGTVTANQFLGDGSQLTGVSTASYIESGGDVVREFNNDSSSIIVGLVNQWTINNSPRGSYRQTGRYNTSVGVYAGGRWSTSQPRQGDKISNFGYGAGISSEASYSVNVGTCSGYYNNSSAQYTVNVGYRAGAAWTNTSMTAYSSVNIGKYAGYYNKGDHSILFGSYAGKYNGYNGVGGSHNISIGYYSGYKNTGEKSTFAGYKSGHYNTGNTSVGIGTYSLKGNTGFRSTAVGDYTGVDNTGTGIVAVGPHALYSNTGAYSVGVGGFAGQSNTGAYLSAVGYSAGNNQSGKNVVAVGKHAAENNTKNYYIEMKSTDSDGRMWFSKDSDWNFGAPVTSSEFKFSDGTSMTTAPTGGAGGGLDSAAVSAVVDETVNDPTKLTLGTNSTSVAIGSGSSASDTASSVSVGRGSSGGNGSAALGAYADASGIGSVAVGRSANASGHYSTAVGRQASTSGTNSLALGYSASAGNYGVALGDATSGERSIAIGMLASTAGVAAAIHINANYNSGVGPSAGGGLVIETSAARLEYSATDKWVFNAQVTAPSFEGTFDGGTF